jgi:hypothetical protein
LQISYIYICDISKKILKQYKNADSKRGPAVLAAAVGYLTAGAKLETFGGMVVGIRKFKERTCFRVRGLHCTVWFRSLPRAKYPEDYMLS